MTIQSNRIPETFATSYDVVATGNGLAVLRFNAKPDPESRATLKGEALAGTYDSKHNVWVVTDEPRTALDAAIAASAKAQKAAAKASAPKAAKANAAQMGPKALIAALRAQGKTPEEIISFLGA